MKKLLWILTGLPLVVTAFALQFMPDSIPVHYNIAGEIDRWGSKYESLIMPVVIIFFTVFWEILFAFYNKKLKNATEEKQRAELISNVKVMRITAVCIAAFMEVMQYISIYNACVNSDAGIEYLEIDSIKVTCVLMGLVFVIIGNFLPKTKLNGTIGLRVTYSMYNDVTWSKSNRFCGFAFIIAGILTAVTSVIFNKALALILMLVYIMALVIISIIYAKKIYDEEKTK